MGRDYEMSPTTSKLQFLPKEAYMSSSSAKDFDDKFLRQQTTFASPSVADRVLKMKRKDTNKDKRNHWTLIIASSHSSVSILTENKEEFSPRQILPTKGSVSLILPGLY